MVPMRMASVGGFTGPRGSLFHGSATDTFQLGEASPRFLGASGQSLYALAQQQVAIFDSLLERTKRIANKQAREAVVEEFGLADPSNKDKSYYMRNAAAGDIAYAESFTPINYESYEKPGPTKSRPGKLKDFNGDFSAVVKNAEDSYGILPAPQVIESIKTVNVSSIPGWVPVVVVGAVGVAVLSALGVFGK